MWRTRGLEAKKQSCELFFNERRTFVKCGVPGGLEAKKQSCELFFNERRTFVNL